MTRIIALFLSAGFGILQAAGVDLDNVRVLTPTVRQYEKIELAWTPERTPANPFDPNEIRLDGRLTMPSGKVIEMPGFWYQGYRRSLQNPAAAAKEQVELLAADGKPEWRLRFSSGEIGQHRFILELTQGGQVRRSRELTVDVTKGPGRGVIRVSRKNHRYLEDAHSRTYFPIGQNLCMYERREGTYYYDRLLSKLRAAGGDYVRLWQEYYVPKEPGVAGAGDGSFTGFPLETQQTGLGKFDLASAWRLDYVSELCERLDIHWQLAFEMVVWWERKQTHRWSRNPYSAANGGPIRDPEDYLTDAKCRELVKRRLRYSVARWGWTSNLLAWELWNEIDNMDHFNSNSSAAWHREMGEYLHQVDPWQHLITTSWRDRQTFAVPEIDIVQGHSYFEPDWDAAEYSVEDSGHLMKGFTKPFFFGEQGIEGPVSVDPEGRHFHDCLWATAMSGAAGTGLYWWWHNYIDGYNLYGQYTGVSRFMNGEDLTVFAGKELKLSRPNVPVTLRVYGLITDDRALVWIHDPLAFRIRGGKGERGPQTTGAALNIVGLDDGWYDIEWWDTTSGKILHTDRADVRKLRHTDYGLGLKPPGFWGDIAAKVFPANRSSTSRLQ
ncbi:MAG: DUF5060 domain-containing protein [Bryobacterales bacterium]|nr:DUF5060 domain-containing protein [Bryobacterales bacterium]